MKQRSPKDGDTSPGMIKMPESQDVYFHAAALFRFVVDFGKNRPGNMGLGFPIFLTQSLSYAS